MSAENLLAILAVLRKRMWLIALLMVVTAGTIVAVFLTSKRVYSASVRFLVTTPPSGEVSPYQGFRTDSARQETQFAKANFIELLQSSTIAWQTVEDLGTPMRGGELADRTEVIQSVESEFVRVKVTADSADEAAPLANVLMENALRYYAELRAKSATNSLIVIASQLEEARRELETATKRLAEFQIENRIGDLDAEIESMQFLITSLLEGRDHAMAAGDVGAAAAYEAIVVEREEGLLALLQLDPAYTALDTDVIRFQSLYSLLLEKQAEAKFKENEARNAGFVQIVEPARRPTSADSPFSVKILAVGVLVSLILGVMLALVLEYFEGLRIPVRAEDMPTLAVDVDSPGRTDLRM